MITRCIELVNTEQLAFQFRSPCIEVVAPIRARLARQPEHRHMRAHVLREPRLVHVQVVMRHADADPSPPREFASATHRSVLFR